MESKVFNKSVLIYAILSIVLTVSLIKDLQLLGILTLIFLIYFVEPKRFEYLFKNVFKKINIGSVGVETHPQENEISIEKSIDEEKDDIKKDYYTLSLEGDKLLFNGDYVAATKKYEESIKLNDKYTNAFINLGAAYHGLWATTKDPTCLEKSIAASKKALELNPKGYRPRINLAVAYSKSENTKDEALGLFEEADQIGKDADSLSRGKVKLFKTQIIIDKLNTRESKKYEARIPEVEKDLYDCIHLFQKASWTNPEALYWIKRPQQLLDYIKSEVWK
jgi:tetratricopeptide (TPR) repeat protein